ncbi:MAG: hypothetical protein ABIJ14_03835 [Nanoarchaeota archaeon]
MVDTIEVNNSRRIKDLKKGDISEIPWINDFRGGNRGISFLKAKFIGEKAGIKPLPNSARFLMKGKEDYQCVYYPIKDGRIMADSREGFVIHYSNPEEIKKFIK